MARISIHNLSDAATLCAGGTQYMPPGGYAEVEFERTVTITGDGWALIRNTGNEPIVVGTRYLPVGAGPEFDVDDELVVSTAAGDAEPAPPAEPAPAAKPAKAAKPA